MIFLVFPNQLFYSNLIKLKNIDKIYLVEDPRYFTDFNFHNMKLVYHRSGLKYLESKLKKKFKVEYIEFNKVNNDFYKKIKNAKCYDPVDYKLEKKLKKIKNLEILDNPNFLLDQDDILHFKNKKKIDHDSFYQYMRKKMDILMKDDKPVKGKWSFDEKNRKPFPKKKLDIEDNPTVRKNKYIKEAISYVEKNFNNYGCKELIYPINEKKSEEWLEFFLKNKLEKYGPYQDAVNTDIPFGYHSVISPMMNIGLLTDKKVINISKEYYQKNKNKIPINSYEGFIRQIIGWRNYVYLYYKLYGEKMYKMNYLKHNNKLSNRWWEAKTNIPILDRIIENINKNAYAHHIERLMFLGNFLLLCQINPKDVHKIFMEWTIDAYDWVMVPNVMGMSQYADGGKMMTRVYFSSSNYVQKMSRETKKKNDEWWKDWDAVYYYFISKHEKVLKDNYATSRQVYHWNNKSKKEKNDLIERGKKYLKFIKSNYK